MTLLLVLAGVFAASTFFVAGVRDLALVTSRRRSLVLGMAADLEGGDGTAIERWDRSFRATRPGRWVQRQLVLAGEEERSAVLVVAVALGGGVVVGYILAIGLAPVFGLLGIAAVVVGARAYLGRAKDRRNEQFIAQMPELARVLSNATSAGLSIAAAVGIAATEMSAPAGPELGRVESRMRFGDSLDTAMSGLEDRLPSREVSVLVSTLLVSARSGGSLVTSLRDIADTLDERKEVRREVRTTLAQSTATGYIVIVMGFALLFLLNFIQPGTVEAMLAEWVGRGALIVGASLFAGGFLLIRRLTRFDG
ncbi:type II secretion system F family protein [Pengzhenrongella sicca]|uniref:Type II secretion system F family protein n=1 Tax=Pengzhenrongella sicca TaxID=2819238 RepID=A0A8A4ZDF9_9MICO|nr:type II secretion system F family protein [Pengzhenrongella sicca]QTE29954.1 type II secretion system F family protein [Pengzhenrongella sicca]